MEAKLKNITRLILRKSVWEIWKDILITSIFSQTFSCFEMIMFDFECGNSKKRIK